MLYVSANNASLTDSYTKKQLVRVTHSQAMQPLEASFTEYNRQWLRWHLAAANSIQSSTSRAAGSLHWMQHGTLPLCTNCAHIATFARFD